MSASIDLNADVGEGAGADAEIVPLLSSASVACGFHAGDPATMAATCALAARHGVRIGAHVSYRDRQGFGRRPRDPPAAELHADVTEQLRALAAASAVPMTYVKPHGALYNRCVSDAVQAGAVLDAIAAHDPRLAVLALPGSALLTGAAARGLRGVAEAFADRAYRPDGTLLDRSAPGSVLGPEAAARQARSIACEGRAGAVAILAASLCLHGDAPDAARTARAIRTALDAASVRVAAFT